MPKLLPVTRQSAVLALAYIQYYTCKFIPGRCLTNTHLRRLAAWLGCPDDTLRTIRRQPTLIAHLALLQAANLLRHNNAFWYLTPDALDWLNRPAASQYDHLLHTVGQVAITLQAMGLADVVTLDVIAYIQQQLEHQAQRPQPQPGLADWQQVGQDGWHLRLPLTLPTNHIFHLLQIGHWLPGQPLTSKMLAISPLTIAQAFQRGYNLTSITHLLEETTGQPLSDDQQQHLLDWYHRHDAYRLRPAILLSVKQPEQLAAIIKNGNLRPHIQAQIHPRHAIAAPTLQPLLQRWTARLGYLLDAPTTPLPPSSTPPNVPPPTNRPDPTPYQWLGLHLLATLGQIIPLPYPPPHAELETLSAHVPPEEQAQMAALAEQIIANLQSAIRGRDAFFPARNPVPPEWIETIRAAMAREQAIDLTYQALGECASTCRRVYPLRLEERGGLHYLYAYCTLAEANRTFRLDRVLQLETKQ